MIHPERITGLEDDFEAGFFTNQKTGEIDFSLYGNARAYAPAPLGGGDRNPPALQPLPRMLIRRSNAAWLAWPFWDPQPPVCPGPHGPPAPHFRARAAKQQSL